MNEGRISLNFAEPKPARIIIEEDVWALKTLSELLTSYAKTQPGDPIYFNDITKAAFLSIAQTITSKVNEHTVDYSGDKYIIMAKGRRKFTLGFKREPDINIGSNWGVNFLDACRSFFSIVPDRHHYNAKKNTFYGRILYPKPVTVSKNYELGLSETATGGFSSWFIIGKCIFRLEEVKSRGEAIIGCKMLHKAFQDILAKEVTKP